MRRRAFLRAVMVGAALASGLARTKLAEIQDVAADMFHVVGRPNGWWDLDGWVTATERGLRVELGPEMVCRTYRFSQGVARAVVQSPATLPLFVWRAATPGRRYHIRSTFRRDDAQIIVASCEVFHDAR